MEEKEREGRVKEEVVEIGRGGNERGGKRRIKYDSELVFPNFPLRKDG